eukprot:2756560-Prymnesium_polylepis.1
MWTPRPPNVEGAACRPMWKVRLELQQLCHRLALIGPPHRLIWKVSLSRSQQLSHRPALICTPRPPSLIWQLPCPNLAALQERRAPLRGALPRLRRATAAARRVSTRCGTRAAPPTPALLLAGAWRWRVAAAR